MAEQLQVTKHPIEPIYSQSNPNEPIDLGRVELQFDDHQGNWHQESANVTMRFLPDHRLDLICPLEDRPPHFGLTFLREFGSQKQVRLTERGIAFDAFCAAVDGDGLHFSPNKSGVIVTPPSTAISRATFHLFNFPDFNGPDNYILVSGQLPLQSSKTCGQAALKADGWNITIASHDRTDSLTKALKAEGGFVITHVGFVVREDGSNFSSEELETLLSCLHYFLSFALGRWAGVAFPVGFDTAGNRVFEQWGLPITADGSWNGSSSWFDLHHGELLSQVFPGFLSLWKKPLWRKPMTEALYWYLPACDRRVGIGVDTGLILAQAALELIAWTYCILDRKMISPAAFKPRGLSAADKLRLLATSLDIPTEIPAALSALHRKPGKPWVDSMDAITGIRNCLVHPATDRQLPDQSYYEGCILSLWYIELVVLRLCGHVGKYANRLATRRYVGTVESVPWAQKSTEGK